MPDPRGEYTAKEMRDAIRRSGGVVLQAADILGCSPATVYRYAEKYSTVQTTLEEARLTLAAQAEGYHARMMRDPDHSHHYKAVKDVLRNYHPDDWSDTKRELEHGGDGFEVNIQPPSDD